MKEDEFVIVTCDIDGIVYKGVGKASDLHLSTLAMKTTQDNLSQIVLARAYNDLCRKSGIYSRLQVEISEYVKDNAELDNGEDTIRKDK